MPTMRELLGDEAALRSVVAKTPPRALARRINGVMAGALDVVDELIVTITALYIELWGYAYAAEFRRALKR